MLELQTLREENQSLKAEVQVLKTKNMQKPELPKLAQEKKNLEEMNQPLPDQAPSPLKDPQDLFEDQPTDQQQESVQRTLKERLQEKLAQETDLDIQANLKWELQVVELAEDKFPQIEQLYEAHRQTNLPLAMMKIEQERKMAIHMPQCKMEDLGGYKALLFRR